MFADSDYVLVDANLNAETIKAVLELSNSLGKKGFTCFICSLIHFTRFLVWFEPTNALKVHKIVSPKNLLGNVTILSPNLAEFKAICRAIGTNEKLAGNLHFYFFKRLKQSKAFRANRFGLKRSRHLSTDCNPRFAFSRKHPIFLANNGRVWCCSDSPCKIRKSEHQEQPRNNFLPSTNYRSLRNCIDLWFRRLVRFASIFKQTCVVYF